MEDNLGLVLSGGGVRGIAHIGLLQALEENGIRPQAIAGTSAGALVGALYAAGHKTEAMLQFFKNTPIFNFSFYSTEKPGLLDSMKYRVFFESYFNTDRFSALNIPLFIAVTDLANAQSHIFSEGELINPLLASAALPPLFSPLEIRGVLYSDGGILNNFPVNTLKGKYKHLIGSYVSPVPMLSKEYFSTTLKTVRRVADLRLYAEAKSKFGQCDFVFIPQEIGHINLLNTKKIDWVYKKGYEAAWRQMPKIKAVLSDAVKI